MINSLVPSLLQQIGQAHLFSHPLLNSIVAVLHHGTARAPQGITETIALLAWCAQDGRAPGVLKLALATVHPEQLLRAAAQIHGGGENGGLVGKNNGPGEARYAGAMGGGESNAGSGRRLVSPPLIVCVLFRIISWVMPNAPRFGRRGTTQLAPDLGQPEAEL